MNKVILVVLIGYLATYTNAVDCSTTEGTPTAYTNANVDGTAETATLYACLLKKVANSNLYVKMTTKTNTKTVADGANFCYFEQGAVATTKIAKSGFKITFNDGTAAQTAYTDTGATGNGAVNIASAVLRTTLGSGTIAGDVAVINADGGFAKIQCPTAKSSSVSCSYSVDGAAAATAAIVPAATQKGAILYVGAASTKTGQKFCKVQFANTASAATGVLVNAGGNFASCNYSTDGTAFVLIKQGGIEAMPTATFKNFNCVLANKLAATTVIGAVTYKNAAIIAAGSGTAATCTSGAVEMISGAIAAVGALFFYLF